ncbi:MAG TPA: putative sulfate exporter family transporter [Paludibacteraceae bacterium]|nr:putative sulfate exporter family transporter [Paludibacteraceae bacterium]
MNKFFEYFKKYNSYYYLLLVFFCLTPWATPPVALFLGLIFTLTLGSPFPVFNKKASKYLLQIAVIGLGFGMNLQESLKAGTDGILFTIISVVSVIVIGILAGKLFKVDKVTSYLISSGTAICGGSAIAAVGPIVRADESQMSVSLATVFVLNAIALFIFPVIGHWLDLSQQQFGTWAAIAIHDTSSVVGAGSAYGEEALKVATTVKLTRALWIIPLSIFTTFYFKSKGDKMYIPWFILFFIVAMLLNTYFNIDQKVTESIVKVSRQCLTLTLFFIGAGLSRENLKTVGVRSLLLGVTLWFFIAVISIVFIIFYF